MKYIKRVHIIAISALLAVSTAWFSAPVAFAQFSQQTITITPPNVSLSLKPGEHAEGTLGLISDAPGDNTFVTGVYDLIVTDTDGTPQVVPPGVIVNNRFSAANWIAVDPPQFTAKPHEKVPVHYYVQIPPTAAPGGHYAAVIYQPVTTGPQSGSGAQILPQIATLFYITVKGNIHEGAKVTQFQAPFFQEFGPVTITTQIQNTGDLHINPQGSITLRNMFGKIVDLASLPSRNIFPGNVSLRYKIHIGRTWMFGRYTATLAATYGIGHNYPLTATVVFWVIPWRLIILLLLILIAGILGFILWRRKQNNEEQQPPTEFEEDITQPTL